MVWADYRQAALDNKTEFADIYTKLRRGKISVLLSGHYLKFNYTEVGCGEKYKL